MARTTRSAQVVTATPPITSFTRVSKGSSLLLNDPLKKTHPTITIELPSRKRKASQDDEETTPSPSATRVQDRTKRSCRRAEPALSPVKVSAAPPSTPVKGKRVAKAAPATTARVHKPVASTILSQANRESRTNQTKIENAFKKAAAAANKPSSASDLPEHLASLVQLHKAFLKTALLQFSHNGSNTPLDIHTLAPQVSGSWGKRSVTVEDIRRCIALESCETKGVTSPFLVTDYGRGKICIELRPRQNASAPLNEDELCRQFENNLRGLCAERSTGMDDLSFDRLSLDDLPKVDITDMNAARIQANPLLTKGQRALAELKNGMAAKQQQDKEAKAGPVASKIMLNPDGSKMSLLDRLRVKELARANGPAPPSGPELQRRAALNRVGDVAATISMLSLSNPMSLPRQAFTMNAIVDRLRDSMRTPISTEEGMICVRLIAKEVAPEWLKVVMIGGRENVVVQRTAQPVDRILRERVEKLSV